MTSENRALASTTERRFGRERGILTSMVILTL